MKQIMIALAVCVLTMGAVSVSQAGNLTDYYDDYLTAASEKCAGKCCFLNSRCCALREYAMKNQAKAEFLESHKAEMITRRIFSRSWGTAGRSVHKSAAMATPSDS